MQAYHVHIHKGSAVEGFILPADDRIGAERLFAEARVGSDRGPLRLLVLLIPFFCLSDTD